jgi:small subunit ribosomal protein S1
VASKTKKSSSKSTKSGKPSTMEELLAQAELKPKSYSLGDEIEGVVIEKNPKSLILDIGGKSEGMVAEKAFQEARGFINELKIGDKVKGRVIVTENPEGFVIISLRNAKNDFFWKKLEKAFKKDKKVKVRAKSANSSGVLVGVYGLSGFIPSSHLGKELTKALSNIADKEFYTKILELDRKLNRVVLSEKFVSEKEEVEEARKAMHNVKKGEVYEGKVTTVADFGCFVEIKVPIKSKKTKVKLEGLVHISELSWDKIDKPSDLVKEGDKVKVKVIDKVGNKLSLSMKQTKDDPWLKASKKYKPESRAKGEVVKISDFGAFVQLEPGIEGLIHMTKIPPGKKLERGQKVNVYIEDIDPEEKRISLGLVLAEKPVGYK